jgi:hypothetical protein
MAAEHNRMANRIQLRRDTTANWANVNPILSDGEMGYDINTNEIRIGDGSTDWTGLSGNTIGGGGGGASTGDVTFSGINIIGDDNLRFQPNVTESGSYLDVYLTVGPDIHLASSDGNLILGGDSAANVRLGTDGNVQIQSMNIGFTSTWTFGSDGNLTIPGNLLGPIAVSPAPIISGFSNANFSGDVTVGNLLLAAGGEITTAAGTGNVVIEANDGTLRTWTFDSTGVLTLPTIGGDEGAEIGFTKAPNSALSGNAVVVDQHVNSIRFFENGGTNRGAYINLGQAAPAVGTLLNNRVSGFVNAGANVVMDSLIATVTTSSQRGLSLAATIGSFDANVAGTYANVSTGGSRASVTITTSPSTSLFGWNFDIAGDMATYIITDSTNSRAYRVTMQIGDGYNNNMISIERLV